MLKRQMDTGQTNLVWHDKMLRLFAEDCGVSYKDMKVALLHGRKCMHLQ